MLKNGHTDNYRKGTISMKDAGLKQLAPIHLLLN